MEILVQHIESVLQSQKHCFVRPEELYRVWPDIPDEQRESVVREFAHRHGWRIFSYGRALGAMFVSGTPMQQPQR